MNIEIPYINQEKLLTDNMKYYINIAESLIERVNSDISIDSISNQIHLRINGIFDRCDIKEYFASRYGFDCILNKFEQDKPPILDQVKFNLKLFGDLIDDYQKLDKSKIQEDFEFTNYKEKSLNQENKLKEIRLKLKNVCKFDVMIEDNSDAIMTYLSFLEGRS